MATPFLGEIKIFSFNFAPKGWALCNGQLLPINQNQALFSLMGTMYGGNGQTTFALPNLQGCVPLHFGAGITQGERAGVRAVSLTANEMPPHTHGLNASASAGTQVSPGGNLLAQNSKGSAGFRTAGGAVMNAGMIASSGGGQAHDNMQPYLVLSFCVALQGIYPSRS
jgi:microcystin-dependent protein